MAESEMTIETHVESQDKPAPTAARPWRCNLALYITPAEYAAMRSAARAERMPFSSWLRNLAFAELKRKKVKIPK